jgi:N-acetylglucosamine malate deacetylase 1
MLNQFKKILVLSPHTDDGELGAGGTIARLCELGADVHYAAFSTAETSVPAHLPRNILEVEVRHATRELGIREDRLHIYKYEVRKLNYVRQEILEELIRLRAEHGFDLVLMPSMNDIHQDHATVATEGLRAFKTTTILGYELIWNNLKFETIGFVTLQEEHVRRKAAALEQYKSQNGRPYMSADFVHSLARARGVQIGADYAEAFEIVRWIMR